MINNAYEILPVHTDSYLKFYVIFFATNAPKICIKLEFDADNLFIGYEYKINYLIEQAQLSKFSLRTL